MIRIEPWRSLVSMVKALWSKVIWAHLADLLGIHSSLFIFMSSSWRVEPSLGNQKFKTIDKTIKSRNILLYVRNWRFKQSQTLDQMKFSFDDTWGFCFLYHFKFYSLKNWKVTVVKDITFLSSLSSSSFLWTYWHAWILNLTLNKNKITICKERKPSTKFTIIC